jgi:hypothetical protein
MGRELRRVVPNWEHPKETKYDYVRQTYKEIYSVIHDWAFEPTMDDWIDEYKSWRNGEYAEYKTLQEFLDWIGDPPEPKYYRPNWKEGEATWFQIYETVSEGTPISPPFATKEELVDWMAYHCDFWGYGWSREQAHKFVFGSGWSVSGVIANGEFKMGYEV